VLRQGTLATVASQEPCPENGRASLIPPSQPHRSSFPHCQALLVLEVPKWLIRSSLIEFIEFNRVFLDKHGCAHYNFLGRN